MPSSWAWSTVPARTASERLGDIEKGQTQLTRMPSAPHSSAAVRLNRRTAALALE